jgi:hypothetical protein
MGLTPTIATNIKNKKGDKLRYYNDNQSLDARGRVNPQNAMYIKYNSDNGQYPT